MELEKYAKQTKLGVFHADSWDTLITKELLNDLLNQAKTNGTNKARLSLNPTEMESLQFAYLAFSRPYKDKIHSHPKNLNIHVPILGEANYHVFSNKGQLIKTHLLTSKNPYPIVTPKGVWNATEIISKQFIKLEISPGIFEEGSTFFLNN